MKRTRRWVAVWALATLMGGIALGCYGRFPLTRAVYDFNGSIGARVADGEPQQSVSQQIVFWAFVIVPVYEVSMLADTIVFNLIEFWTEETIGDEIEEELGRVGAGDATGDTALADAGLRLEQASRAVLLARGPDGEVLGRALKASDGSVTLTDARGGVVVQLDRKQLAGMSDSR